MTIADVARDSLSNQLTWLAKQVEETGWPLIEFTNDFTRVVNDFRQLVHAIRRGKTLIVSLDLCELIDMSMSFREQNRLVRTANHPAEERRILVDTTFSSHAIRRLRQNKLPITILPVLCAAFVSSFLDFGSPPLSIAWSNRALLAKAVRK